ncbi:hypothetical protein HPB49_019561 [Dermacentor silvarum]|uniref:Uncharacterized protein n=1 Tax=Dermacentor silvarum TaxID=543639 RepID=A0ACB8CSV8_DERSI|nr:hypothetical protein HPB49_019561 [Dermacentor silvarum]
MVVAASSFVLLNIRHGTQPMRDIGGVALALVAYTLSFTSPLRGHHATSMSGRVAMGFWMLAGFSLAAYTRSLLIASLMAQPTWDADDTLDKLLPKLQQGRLLPCAESNSFFDVLLTTTTGNASGVVHAMAKSAKRWARSRGDFTGSIQSCLERTRRGTHVLFAGGIDPCRHSQFQKTIVEGQEQIRTLIGGFPVRRDYERRSELISLVRRIFETGWDLRITRNVFNCHCLGSCRRCRFVTVIYSASFQEDRQHVMDCGPCFSRLEDVVAYVIGLPREDKDCAVVRFPQWVGDYRNRRTINVCTLILACR